MQIETFPAETFGDVLFAVSIDLTAQCRLMAQSNRSMMIDGPIEASHGAMQIEASPADTFGERSLGHEN